MHLAMGFYPFGLKAWENQKLTHKNIEYW